MPLVLLTYKTDRKLAKNLAAALPEIIAPQLSISDREPHDGNLTPDEIEVYCREGQEADVNTKDLEIVVWAHDYPERRENLEERKNKILDGVWKFLEDYDYDWNFTGFVWILLQPSAFGRI